ncbi:MAG: nucleotidyltransferase domain-containing protein [Eubacteriales bacterium]|nr:nucleotidyltransferase domain-containing protein [Eubacteriales bacterium]
MDIARWMEAYTAAVRQAFGKRVRCVGLQGSQARGEAAADSDIDVVLILDRWEPEDWPRYETVLAGLPERDRVCGFVSGREELLCWEPSELCGFYYDTEPWYGNLEELKERFGVSDARRAVRMGACGIYHACAHNRLHEKDAGLLRELYKSAFFVLRTAHFCRTGAFIRRRADLLPLLGGADRAILAAGLPDGETAGGFTERSDALLGWAAGVIRSFSS